VDPHTEGAPVELTYKASIVQTTGEVRITISDAETGVHDVFDAGLERH